MAGAGVPEPGLTVMSHTFIPTTTVEEPGSGGDEHWADELCRWLRPDEFPAGRGALTASLLRRHAPARVLWRLSCLPEDSWFDSTDDMVACIAQRVEECDAVRYQPREPSCQPDQT
ncbi:MAG: hypothetical protein JWP82_1928 [Humibacillus sp.]|nr:hypothetical protein [Humibacillus sp.]